MSPARRARDPILWTGTAFIVLLLFMPATRPLFALLFPGVDPPVFQRESFLALFLSHAGLVAAACAIAGLSGIGLGIAVTRPWGREFRAIADAIAAIGQTIPPVAVLAITVPLVGFGARPTLIALSIYGFMPILAGTVAGLDGVPAAAREAAAAMGMAPAQVLRRIELPLAAPVILAGLRVSVIYSIGTATIGSTVGAATLGTPIVDGLVSDKLNFAIQGALLVGLFAILTDLAFERLGAWLARGKVRR
jgi:osmoprotectant transport system permease protein